MRLLAGVLARVDVDAAGEAVAVQAVAETEHLATVLLAVVGVRHEHLDVAERCKTPTVK